MKGKLTFETEQQQKNAVKNEKADVTAEESIALGSEYCRIGRAQKGRKVSLAFYKKDFPGDNKPMWHKLVSAGSFFYA